MAYKHIGVAISGNEEDALLVNKALELARHNDAHLTLIHIDDGLSELYPGIYFPATEDILQLLKNKSDNKLYKLTKNIQWPGNDSNLLIVFYVQIMPDDFVMQLHRF